jgi:chromosomal replication initiation ATPase DnaA
VQPPQQPALQIFGGPRYAAADFREAPSNSEALAWLNRTGDWPSGRLALWGEAGRGKTHLLHIWAARTGATVWLGRSLEGLPELPEHGIALDDADSVTDETALFHLLNAASEARLLVLLASRTAPARWPVRLPDLVSRLRAITAVEIGPPEDSLLRMLFARLLDDRGLRLPAAVLEWLLPRLPRTAAGLGEAVVRLSDVSMERHRTITIAWAREVLTGLIDPEPDEISGTATPPSQDAPPVL